MEVWRPAAFITDGVADADEGEFVVVDGVRPWDALPICAGKPDQMLSARRGERYPLAVRAVEIACELVMARFGCGRSVAAQVVADPCEGLAPASAGFGLRMIIPIRIVVIDTRR